MSEGYRCNWFNQSHGKHLGEPCLFQLQDGERDVPPAGLCRGGMQGAEGWLCGPYLGAVSVVSVCPVVSYSVWSSFCCKAKSLTFRKYFCSLSPSVFSLFMLKCGSSGQAAFGSLKCHCNTKKDR